MLTLLAGIAIGFAVGFLAGAAVVLIKIFGN